MAVSATFTSVNVCDEGKPPDTQAMFTWSASKVSLTTSAILGYTQIAATLSRSGYLSTNSFTFPVNFITLSSESVHFKVVRSMQWNRNFFTSGVLFSATCFSMSRAVFAFTSSSRKRMLYLASASSYLLCSGP